MAPQPDHNVHVLGVCNAVPGLCHRQLVNRQPNPVEQNYQDLPGCDPADEHIILDWHGGDLSLELEYFTLVRQGDPSIQLVNAEGKVISSAVFSASDKVSTNFAPRTYETHGNFTLGVKSLPKGRYYLKVGGPLPTYFLYKSGTPQ